MDEVRRIVKRYIVEQLMLDSLTNRMALSCAEARKVAEALGIDIELEVAVAEDCAARDEPEVRRFEVPEPKKRGRPPKKRARRAQEA